MENSGNLVGSNQSWGWNPLLNVVWSGLGGLSWTVVGLLISGIREMCNTPKNRSKHTSVSSGINSVAFGQYLMFEGNFKGKHCWNLGVRIFPFPCRKLCGNQGAQAQPGQQRASISDKCRLSRTKGERGGFSPLTVWGFPFCLHHYSALKLSFYWATESLVFSALCSVS